jgi:hypothetical protein
MTDLWLAAGAMAGTSAVLFCFGLALGRRLSPRAAAAVALTACAFIVAFVLLLSDNILLARLLPFSSLIVLGDWLPPAVALLAGLAWRRMPGHAARKAVLVFPLVALCGFRSYGHLFGDVPALGPDRWKAGVCRQTSQASCSPAAAATLLRAHGIDATEAEMASLCLTRPAGTSMHGLYRGLKLKTRGTPWDVDVFRGDLGALRRDPGPAILSVRLDSGPGVDARYEQLWGWAPGVNHTVVFFVFRPDGKTDVGDPAVGLEHWREEDVRVLWHGEGCDWCRGSNPGREREDSKARRDAKGMQVRLLICHSEVPRGISR